MLRYATVGALSLGLLGCSDPSAQMKIESPKGSSDEAVILLGTLALPNSGIQQWAGELDVSDGEIRCVGTDEGSKVDMGWAVGRLRHDINVQCDDGRTGVVKVSLSGTTRENMSGVGVGKLSDGSKVRLVVGDAVGALSW